MTTPKKCRHRRFRTIRTSPYTGPVSQHQNLAAHGNVTRIDECSSCGARRDRNVNGVHVEKGTWYTPTTEA
jgi:hypothetical protein